MENIKIKVNNLAFIIFTTVKIIGTISLYFIYALIAKKVKNA